MRRFLWRAAFGAFLAATILGFMGCAVIERDNRPLLNTLDEKVRPQSTAARIALAPPAIPAATAALIADAVVIRPVAVIPDAWDDIHELYWKPRDERPLRRAVLFPVRVVLTPPTFVGDWALRTMFPID